jgi:hypothetical protein
VKPLLAIARLTWKAAFRFRLFWALAGLLLLSAVALPLLLKDDGTARGFIQILLTYNLSVIISLLGFATLWLACGTLARDIEDCQIQLVAVKPVPRWQIWLGKWLGIMMLNAMLLAVAGGSVFLLLQWRAQQLPEAQRQILKNEVFVARASLKEPPPDLAVVAERIFRKRLAQTPVADSERAYVRQQILEQVRAGVQIVPPDFRRRWVLDLGLKAHWLKDQPMFLRFKFHAAQTNTTDTFLGLWQVGPPETDQVFTFPMSLAPDTFHEVQIPSNLFEASGKLTVEFINRNDVALLFPLEDGFEVLYREGGFGLNYMRGLLILLSWLGLLAALGLAAGSFLSFPVAAFFSVSLLVVGLSSGSMAGVVEEGTVTGLDHETGVGSGARVIDAVLLPVFKGILKIVGLVEAFSPVDALSTGRSITWPQLAQAWGQVVLFLGGLLACLGILIFSRRELALPQAQA